MREHTPVLLSEVVSTFRINLTKDDLIIDATVGRAGHFIELLAHFNNLIAIDADSTSISYLSQYLTDNRFISNSNKYVKAEKNVEIHHLNFSKLHDFVKSNNLQVKGVLVDLGISMFHYKESSRGFSFLNPEEDLDMRIDTENNVVKAKDLLNKLSEKDIKTLLLNLGDEYRAKDYAASIVNYRNRKKIETVADLLFALKIDTNRKYKVHPATKVFMALRIAVNSEHLNLKELLYAFESELKEGILFLIITFHSLEEKTVEIFCKQQNIFYQKIYPTNEEIIKNKSSRSAKLFIIKNV